jgi:hypothetical protein
VEDFIAFSVCKSSGNLHNNIVRLLNSRRQQRISQPLTIAGIQANVPQHNPQLLDALEGQRGVCSDVVLCTDSCTHQSNIPFESSRWFLVEKNGLGNSFHLTFSSEQSVSLQSGSVFPKQYDQSFLLTTGHRKVSMAASRYNKLLFNRSRVKMS